ncbi:MAG: hypothetical protein H7X80_08755 [bacterium]|nr:hypothetical protein [Candidatus Kapabacteria bacterium]
MKSLDRLAAGFALALLFSLFPSVSNAQEENVSNAAAVIRARPAAIDALVVTLNQQISLVAPSGLTKAQAKNWREQKTLLIDLRERYVRHATELRASLTNAGTSGFGTSLEGSSELVDAMAQMNMQFLALQEATQMESRRFQTLSNASKARHDIALNAIRNVK